MFSVLFSVLAALCSCMSVIALFYVIRVYSWTRNPFITRNHRRIFVEEFRRISIMLGIFGTSSAVLWAAAILTKGL